MNMIPALIEADEHMGEAPTGAEAEAALETLRRLVRFDPATAAGLGLGALTALRDAEHGAMNRSYPEGFVADAAYKATMPDLQNGPASLIKGAKASIQHVGISNFRMPLAFETREGSRLTLETAVTGSVSLDASKKGINMSRIMRSFYKHAERPVDFDALAAILDAYQADLDSLDARLMLRFRYPMLKPSLRSGLSGYQYYDVAMEVVRAAGETLRIVHFDYVYSSTCPCSLELSEHARLTRNQIATPHSQRSVARLSAAVDGARRLWVEDLAELCRSAVPTETQVMVKREDEQAFAELNGANPIFVEDAVRLFCAALEADDRIGDFRVAASHQESLHSHDAVSVLTRGETFASAGLDRDLFATLHHPG